jgi:hypothetical protein
MLVSAHIRCSLLLYREIVALDEFPAERYFGDGAGAGDDKIGVGLASRYSSPVGSTSAFGAVGSGAQGTATG